MDPFKVALQGDSCNRKPTKAQTLNDVRILPPVILEGCRWRREDGRFAEEFGRGV